MKKTLLTVIFTFVLAITAQAQELYDPQLLFHFGPSGYFPRTDYVGRMPGMNIGLEYFSSKGNVWMFDVSGVWGRAKKDLHTSEGWIYKHESIVSTQLFLNYGRVVKQTRYFQCFPFVGMGAGGFDLYYTEDDDYDYPTKDGFAMDIGVGLDWNFCRGKQRWSQFAHSGLLIKPFMSVAFLHAPVKIVPSFNIAVCYCFGIGENH